MTTGQIRDLIEMGGSLKSLAQSYSELASLRLRRTRLEVENNKRFFNELTRVYALVNRLAVAKKVKLALKPKARISILLTSNYRFYGNINNALTRYFIIQSAKFASDKVVIGKTGQDFLKAIRYFHPFESIRFKNDLPDDAELSKLGQMINRYNQVLIFYSEFKSVLVQTPTIKDITQTQTDSLKGFNKPQTDPLAGPGADAEFFQQTFISEPEIQKMADFFDTQIKVLLLSQTILESELARTASRLISMDQAQTNANDFIKEQEKNLALIHRSRINYEILQTNAALRYA